VVPRGSYRCHITTNYTYRCWLGCHIICTDDSWQHPTRCQMCQIWVTHGNLSYCHVTLFQLICMDVHLAAYGPTMWHPYFSIFLKTLNDHNFLIQRLFEAIHAPLEISRQALCNGVIFIIIWEYHYLSVMDPPGSLIYPHLTQVPHRFSPWWELIPTLLKRKCKPNVLYPIWNSWISLIWPSWLTILFIIILLVFPCQPR